MKGLTQSWERRPCNNCGHVRRVKVSRWDTCFQGEEPVEHEQWSVLCKACVLLERSEEAYRYGAECERKRLEILRKRAAKAVAEGLE